MTRTYRKFDSRAEYVTREQAESAVAAIESRSGMVAEISETWGGRFAVTAYRLLPVAK